jgi:hypothetical protein
MKNLLFILCLFFSLSLFGQVCDTVNGDLINCVDSNGLRQGFWELKRENTLFSSYTGLGSKEGCLYSKNAEYFLLARGEYKDDKKTGSWEYYFGNKVAILERRVSYNKDGSVVENNFRERYKIKISSDTAKISGEFYHDLDTLTISCQNRVCSIMLPDGQEVLSFGFTNMDKFEYEFYRLRIGVYDRQIKKKKDKR